MPTRVPKYVWRWARENATDALVIVLLAVVAVAGVVSINRAQSREDRHFQRSLRVLDRQQRALRREQISRCQQSAATRIAVRKVLTFAEAATITRRPPPSPEQVRSARQFYTQALKLVPPIFCPSDLPR